MPTKAELEAELLRTQAAHTASLAKLAKLRRRQVPVKTDARNRAFRTAVQVVAIEILVLVVPFVLDVLDGEITQSEAIRAALRAVLAAGLAYLMRLRTPPAHET